MDNKSGKLVIVRHGESEWNKANLFTGKQDVHLTGEGYKASEALGLLIEDIEIHKVFSSMQARAIETEVCMMGGSGHCSSETIHYTAALNERDYGDYTGQNKAEKEKEIGKEESNALHRAWDYPIPNGETLKMVYERVVPFLKQEVFPILKNGENVLIVSHGNTVRSIIKYIEKISDEDISKVEMPFNQICIYELDQDGYMLEKEIRKLGDNKYKKQQSRIRSSTQIIATLGPVSEKPEIIEEMVKAGMDVVRLNFSWSVLKQKEDIISAVRKIQKENNINILIIGDLVGPRVQETDGHMYDVNMVKAITDKDKEYIKFNVENGVDYIAVSFVGNKEDIIDCREEIKKYSGKQKIIAKIERQKAIENIDEIIEVADAIMIARGDLGNEVPIEKIPFIQNDIIKKCKKVGKPVITATQMLYSMKDNPSPTRAEVTDVVNAILEGSDAVMLSEETAIGKYPIRAVYVMEHIALEAENHLSNSKFNSL